ncbi:MAG TPA: hypothetical protein VFK21_12905 [Gammaproteobacteria bacterium]|nr:hypothetical protein [Gammaproteobacteria bacterium]
MQPLPRATRAAARALVAGSLVAYPVAIYFADGYLTPSQLLAGLLWLLAARLLLAAWISPKRLGRDLGVAMLLIATGTLVLRYMPNVELAWLRYYPALFGLVAFGVFFGSLFTDTPLVERIARAMDHALPPEGVAHCRRVTWAWCALLAANVLISLYTAYAASLQVWTLYNGVIVYFLFGAMLLGEYLLRLHLRRRWEMA